MCVCGCHQAAVDSRQMRGGVEEREGGFYRGHVNSIRQQIPITSTGASYGGETVCCHGGGRTGNRQQNMQSDRPDGVRRSG